MTTFLLIRHGSTDAIGKWMAGRQPGISLNAEGEMEAERIVQRLSSVPIAAIYSSPMERTRQTADPLSKKRKIEIEIREEFNEIDCGNWTGKSFRELDDIPAWHRFNSFRSSTTIPGGESMLNVTSRMIRGLEELHEFHERACVAIFSHGDPIRAAVAHYAGMPLDFLQRIEVHPASITVVKVHDYGAQILKLNDTGELVVAPDDE